MVKYSLRALLALIFLSLTSSSISAQTFVKVRGRCERGGAKVKSGGTESSTKTVQTFPGCTVRVYTSGSTTNAQIYSDSTGTVKSNPFTADSSTGDWEFWVGEGELDIQLSGGIAPNNIISPFYWATRFNSSGGAKDKNTIDATSYGVKCDGITNDTAAFNAAQTAARLNAKRLAVKLPPGRCLINQSVLGDYDGFIGAGMDSTIVVGVANNPIFKVSDTAFHAYITDLTIEGNLTLPNQIGLELEGAGQYWGFRFERVKIINTGSHAWYIGANPFSITVNDIHISNPKGYHILADSPIAPGLVFNRVYLHNLNPNGPLIPLRLKRGRFVFRSLNGVDNAPSIAGTWYAKLGKRPGLGGLDSGDTNSGGAHVQWIDTNFECYEAGAIDHYYFSSSTFKNCTFAYCNSPSGANANRIGLRYEIDETLGQAYAAYLPRGSMDSTTVIGQPETDYKNNSFIHSNNVPPLEISGLGGAVAPPSLPLAQYYDTENSKRENLFRADGKSLRVTAVGSQSYNRPTITYIESVSTGAARSIQIPWAGWYKQGQVQLTVVDVTGDAQTNPITITTQAQGTINGVSYVDIKRNHGAVTLMPYESNTVTGVEWRIVNEYSGGVPVVMATNGAANLGFFTKWEAPDKIGLNSGLYQYNNDIVVNGGNFIMQKNSQTLTISPHATTAGYHLKFPQAPNGAMSCMQMDSTGQMHLTGLPCGSSVGGSVSSVGLSAPSIFSISGSPITASGTLNLTFATGQAANQVLASPDGTSGAVGLRALTVADIPQLTLAKLPNLTGPVLLGKATGTGVPETITLGTNLSFSGTTLNATGGGSSNPFVDNTDLVKNSADNTKLLRLSAANVATATTRTLTAQDASYTLAGLETAQTFTALNKFTNGLWAHNGNDNGVTIGYEAGANSTTSDAIRIGFFANGGTVTSGNAQGIHIGRHAGFNQNNGSNAITIGHAANQYGTGSSGGAVIIGGYAARNPNQTANFYTFSSVLIGENAGNNAPNSQTSVKIGTAAGKDSTNSVGGVMVGANAGESATNAGNSVMLGNYAGRLATNAVNSVLIGNEAGRTLSRSNSLVIDGNPTYSAAGNTGLIYGEFDNRFLKINGSFEITGTPTLSALAGTGTRVPVASSTGVISASAVTSTELGYLTGVTSAIQTQLNAKQASGSYVTTAALPLSVTSPSVGQFLGWNGSAWANLLPPDTTWNYLQPAVGALAINNTSYSTTITQTTGVWTHLYTGATGASNLLSVNATSNNAGDSGYAIYSNLSGTSTGLKPIQLRARNVTVLDSTATGALTAYQPFTVVGNIYGKSTGSGPAIVASVNEYNTLVGVTPRGLVAYEYDTGGFAHSAHITGAKARGTAASPSTILSGDYIAGFTAELYDGTSWRRGGYLAFTNETISGSSFDNAAELKIAKAGSEVLTASFTNSATIFVNDNSKLTLGSAVSLETAGVERMNVSSTGLTKFAKPVAIGAAAAADIPLLIDTSVGTNVVSFPSLLVTGDKNTERLETRSYGGTAVSPGFQGRNIGGTVGSPAATPSGAFLVFFGGTGHDGTSLVAGNRALLAAKAEETWTTTAQGAYFGIETTAPGGVSRTEKMRVQGNGDIYLPASSGSIGLIMKSPDGTCYRATVANGGTWSIASTTCP